MSARSTRLPLGRITAALISRTNLRTGSVPPNACPNRHERLWNISVPKLQRAQRFLRPVLVFGAVGALAIVIYASIILAARGGVVLFSTGSANCFARSYAPQMVAS